MLSPRAGSPRPARDTGLAMQLFAPALALLVVFVLIGMTQFKRGDPGKVAESVKQDVNTIKGIGK